MRSFAFTVLLALFAALVCGVIGWRIRDGNLDAILGIPPVPPGQRLYTNFSSDDVARISVQSQGTRAEFVKTPEGWKSVAPPYDRMSPIAATGIISLALNLKVTDFADSDEIDRDQAGLREGSVQLELENASGASLAHFRMGNRTPLLTENTETGVPVANFYIQPRERGRKEYVYSCAGDISDLFTDGLKNLRDRRPFYINPLLVQKIRLRGDQGELTLGKEAPNSPWRIVKPLDLRTDRTAVLALLEGLVGLNATRVEDRSSVTLPVADSANKTVQIAVTVFGKDKETILEVYPPASPDATERLATISDRPDTVFHLPTAGPGSLVNLPITVNELRDRALTHLDVASIRGISLNPITGSPILITIDPPKPWQVEINGKIQEANEQRLFALLKALGGKAVDFESDAATDLTPWGLDKPVLVIEVIDGNKQGLRLNFGIDKHGDVFVNRQGTLIVMQVERSLLSSISIQPHEWRHARLWSIATFDLESLQRTVRDEPPLELSYNDPMESWRGKIGDTDVTDRIDPAKAKFMLNSLVGVNVSRWLAVGDPAAEAALAAPVFTLTAVERIINDEGDDTGEKRRRTITLAPMKDSSDFYGKLSGEPHPFIMDRETAFKIGTDPLEKAQP